MSASGGWRLLSVKLAPTLLAFVVAVLFSSNPLQAGAHPMVAAGWRHTAGLKSDGAVVAAGWDLYGQVGGVEPWTGITDLAAGWYHTAGLRSDGTVVAAGRNDWGQVSGVRPWLDIVQVSAAGGHTVGLKADGTVVAVGPDENGQVSGVGSWSGIVQVAAGTYHTVGLKSDGTVVAVGYNNYGQVGGVGRWTGITQVAAGWYHTVGLQSDGTVVAVGDNDYGQVGGVGLWTGIVQVAAGSGFTVGLRSDGTVVAAGYDEYGQVSGVGGWTGIARLAANTAHVVGLKCDGTVVAAGANEDGQSSLGLWNLGTSRPLRQKYFPHLVFGDGSEARIGVQNLAGEPATVGYRIVSRDGVAISVGAVLDLQPRGVGFFDFATILAARGVDLNTLGVYWLRLSSSHDFGATGIQTLRVGGVDLLPYGALPAPACARSGVIVAESERVRSGLALLNSSSNAPIGCTLTLSEGGTAAMVAEADVEVPGGSQISFFLDERLDYQPGPNRGLLIECDGPVVVYSLQQDRFSGDTNAVASTCGDLD